MVKWRTRHQSFKFRALITAIFMFVKLLTISKSGRPRIRFWISLPASSYQFFMEWALKGIPPYARVGTEKQTQMIVLYGKYFCTALYEPSKNFHSSVHKILVYAFANKNVSDLLVYSPKKKCESWRFLTYILLHNNCIHLGLNIVIQCVLGVPLEHEQGHMRTGGVYIGGGLAGSLGTSVFENESMLVGASGCVYALLISHISHIILNYNSLKYVLHRSFAVTILTVADLAHICYHMYVFNNESPRIGLAAHLAGALSGFLYGTLFFNGTVKWKNHVHLISGVVVSFLLILVIIFNLKSGITCSTDA